MATQQLQLGTDDAVLREIGEELMPEEMGIHPLRDASRHCVCLDRLGIFICGLPSRHCDSRAGQVVDRLLVRREPQMWQPLGRVAPAIPLIAERFLGSPTHPIPLCGTTAVACCQAAVARNPLMRKASPCLCAVWHGLCLG